MEGFRGTDEAERLVERMPWMTVVERTALRVSEALKMLGVVHASIGEFVLPFYRVPHPSKELVFAVKLSEEGLNDLAEKLGEHGFRRRARGRGEISITDLELNNPVRVLDEPWPLKWDDEAERRIWGRKGVKVLSAEDYAVALLVRGGMRPRELAAKLIYAWVGELDEEYLRRRAEEYGVLGEVEELLRELR